MNTQPTSSNEDSKPEWGYSKELESFADKIIESYEPRTEVEVFGKILPAYDKETVGEMLCWMVDQWEELKKSKAADTTPSPSSPVSDSIEQDKTDYIPFGEEWAKEMSKFPKEEIIKMLGKALAKTAYTVYPSSPEWLTKDTQFLVLPNIPNRDGISDEWIRLWDQIENWYGDIEKKETGEQFLKRLQSYFSLSIRGEDAAFFNKIAKEGLERLQSFPQTVEYQKPEGRQYAYGSGMSKDQAERSFRTRKFYKEEWSPSIWDQLAFKYVEEAPEYSPAQTIIELKEYEELKAIKTQSEDVEGVFGLALAEALEGTFRSSLTFSGVKAFLSLLRLLLQRKGYDLTYTAPPEGEYVTIIRREDGKSV